MWRPLIDLYVSVFEEGQRETEPAILRNLVTSQNPREGGHLIIAALDEGGRCVGGNIFSYLPAIHCGYVSYIFVRPGLRNRGMGTGLLEEMRRCLASEATRLGHSPVLGLFAEIERGDHPGEALQRRFRFWARAGVLPLDVDWQYPPLHQGEPPVPTYFAFGPYRGKRRAWYPGHLEDVARAIFDATYSYLPAAAQTLTAILDGLHRLPPDRPVRYLRAWQAAHARRA
jgi:GNAT superfamily N-acetyltransferase